MIRTISKIKPNILTLSDQVGRQFEKEKTPLYSILYIVPNQ